MKRIRTILIGLLCCLSATAGLRDRYEVTLLGNYGFNTTWQHYGGGEVRAYLPFNDNFVMKVNAAFRSSNVHVVSVNCQPRFDLPVGEMFLDGSLLSAAYLRNRTHSYAMAASLGYRMDYVSAQFGFHSLITHDMDLAWHDEANYIVEPFNFLYRVEVGVRPKRSPWNVTFGFSDFTETQYERMWHPIFFAGAHYDLPILKPGHGSDDVTTGNIRHWRLLAEVYCKPTGMFHLDASFYGAECKMGVTYRF